MSERYQKEIEEILEQSGDPATSKGRPQKGSVELKQPTAVRSDGPRPRGRVGGVRRWPISPGRLLLAGVVLLLVALVLRATLPAAVGPVAWAGVGLFIVAYVLFFIQPRHRVEKRWRGRPVEDRPPRRSLARRVRRWFSPK